MMIDVDEIIDLDTWEDVIEEWSKELFENVSDVRVRLTKQLARKILETFLNHVEGAWLEIRKEGVLLELGDNNIKVLSIDWDRLHIDVRGKENMLQAVDALNKWLKDEQDLLPDSDEEW